MRLKPTVELDGMHERYPVGEVRREDAQARTDLQHGVVRVELGEAADHAEDVLVHEEVLSELAVWSDREPHGSENAAAALASMRAPRSAASTPRTLASSSTVSTTFAGSFGRPRRACGAR